MLPSAVFLVLTVSCMLPICFEPHRLQGAMNVEPEYLMFNPKHQISRSNRLIYYACCQTLDLSARLRPTEQYGANRKLYTEKPRAWATTVLADQCPRHPQTLLCFREGTCKLRWYKVDS